MHPLHQADTFFRASVYVLSLAGGGASGSGAGRVVRAWWSRLMVHAKSS